MHTDCRQFGQLIIVKYKQALIITTVDYRYLEALLRKDYCLGGGGEILGFMPIKFGYTLNIWCQSGNIHTSAFGENLDNTALPSFSSTLLKCLNVWYKSGPPPHSSVIFTEIFTNLDPPRISAFPHNCFLSCPLLIMHYLQMPTVFSVGYGESHIIWSIDISYFIELMTACLFFGI